MNDQDVFHRFVSQSFNHDIAAATYLLETLPEDEAAVILQALPMETAVKAIRNLQIGFAAGIVQHAGDDFLQNVSGRLDPRIAGALLMHLEPDQRQRLKAHLPAKIQTQIREYLDYPEGSIGRIMTTHFLVFNQRLRAAEAIERVRSLAAQQRFPSSYAYVVDDDNRLCGVLNMRELMLALPHQRLESIISPEVFSLNGFTGIQEAAAALGRRRYFAVPVVDGENHIVGIIKAEWLIQGVREDVVKDIQKMFGAGGDEKVFSSIGHSLRKRLPWLHVNLATAFLAAGVVAFFEDIIARLTILAVFLPVVAGQGGNAGAQSLAVVMRGIVMREIPKNKTLQLIAKEGRLGAVNGAIIGVVTALVAWAWNGNPFLGLVIGLGMLFNLFFAGLAGASIPLLMKCIGIDPAQSSSIILTTVTDVMGFVAFLGFAAIFQRFLL